MSSRSSIFDHSLSQNPPSSPCFRSKKIRHVSNMVWKQYSSWSQKYCQQTLQSLSRPTLLHIDSRSEEERPKNSKKYALTASPDTCTISDYVDGVQYSIDDYPVRTQTITPDTLELEKAIPYPPYHNCTSISQNVLVGDDSDYLPFVPFADDENYDYSRDFELHHYNAWQKRYLDFNVQYMLYETIRRLLSEGDISIEEIDENSLLPLECQEIIQFSTMCDVPTSFPFQETIPPINRKHTPISTVEYFLEYFCSNLNCTTGFCAMHGGEAVKAQVPTHVPPKSLPINSSTKISTACGPLCGSLPRTSDTVGSTWTPKDLETLVTALRYAPDTTSCDLAVICRKPCHEIQSRRKSHAYPIVRTRANKGKQPAQPKSRSFEDEKPNRFTPNMPCRHEGPCDSSSACECYKNKGHCHTRCGCNKSCPRRWKGCSCAKSDKVCGTKKCSCYRAYFECDPEVCIPCGSRDETHNLCKNTGIQRGAFKETEVRESKWGLGLFLSEDCEEGDLLSEYVGEMIGPLTVDSRNVRAEYRQRSYVFQLNPTYALDGVYAGNTTRYMNHSSDASNCDTRVMFINGEHRIGVYAAWRLAKGEELLIDYGTEFWKPKDGELPLGLEPSLPPATLEDSKDLTYDPSPDEILHQ